MVLLTEDRLRNFAAFLPKYSALYRVSNGTFRTLYVSDRLPALLGMTYLTEEMDLPVQAKKNLRKVEVEPEPYPYEDFIGYINAVIRPLCEEKRQTLLVDTEPVPGYVPLIDIGKLNRICFNLLSNAVKYTPEGGIISLQIAEDGRAGVDAFSQSALNYFDCILMDIRMPVLDGIGAAKMIRSLGRPDAGSVPIIAMTADAFADDVQKCIDAGMNAHLSKPVEPEKLFRTIQKFMNTCK